MTEEEKKYDRIAELMGRALRTVLKKKNLYDNNIEIELRIGRYSAQFNRNHGVMEVLRDIPQEVFDEMLKAIEEAHELWFSGDQIEMAGDHSAGEYNTNITIDGLPYEIKDTSEIEKRIEHFENRKVKAIEREDYEKAGQYNDLIRTLKNRLTSS